MTDLAVLEAELSPLAGRALEEWQAHNTAHFNPPSRGLGWRSAVTHCPRGHPYFGSNVLKHHAHRECRACVALLRGVSPDVADRLAVGYVDPWLSTGPSTACGSGG